MSTITIDTRLIGGTFEDYTPKLRLDFGKKARRLSDTDFLLFCRENPDVRIEMDKNGDLDIMPPTGAETGIKNFKLTVKFGIWVPTGGTGQGFDSSTGFALQTAPDARPIYPG